MQSLLSINKACMDLRLPVLTESEAGTRRRQRVNCRNRRRRNWSVTVACGAERNGNGNGREESGGSMGASSGSSHNYAFLKRRMEVAAKSEVSNYLFFVNK